MNRKIFFAIILVIFFSVTLIDVLGAGRFFRITWSFTPDDNWIWGHPGRVLFDLWVTNSWASAGIDPAGYLSGNFWLGNVGWATFSHNEPWVERAQILCTDEVFHDPKLTCPLTGFAWSQNAGWISLSGSFIDGGSGVYYDPSLWVIQGFGFSSNMGWIPFYADAGSVLDPLATVSQTWILLDGIGVNFIGKIAVIWNIAGTRIYNLTNQQVGYIFTTINHSEVLNTIRKNIALMTRNISTADLIDEFSSKFNFLVIRWSDYDTTVGWWTWPVNKKTIIIIWGDVILGQKQIGMDTDPDRAIIALKDDLGNGGNIIVNEDVQRIYSFLYAEGSLYSWTKSSTGVIVPYVTAWAWNIPANQLYIKWAIISKNTIGWALQTPSVCPVVINNCTPEKAQIYDLNYFRTYDSTDSTQKAVPYNDPRFWRASFVIDYNNDLVSNPPPGVSAVFP